MEIISSDGMKGKIWGHSYSGQIQISNVHSFTVSEKKVGDF